MLKPICGEVLVRMPAAREQVVKGIVVRVDIPDEPGVVVAVAADVEAPAVGEKVLMPRHCGDRVVVDKVVYRLAKAKDILAVVED